MTDGYEKIKKAITYCRDLAHWLVDTIDNFPIWQEEAAERKDGESASESEHSSEKREEHSVSDADFEVVEIHAMASGDGET